MVPIPWAGPLVPPANDFLRQDPDLYRVAGIGPVMAPNLSTLCHLQDVRGYDVPVESRYHTFFQTALRGKMTWWIYELPKIEMESLPFLSLLNVKYVLSAQPLPPPLSLVYDQEIKIYLNPGAFSRAFLVHQVETVKNGSEALERVMTLGPELRRVAVLESPLPPTLSNLSMRGREPATEDRVRLLTYTARQVEIEVETSSPGLLVLGDTYFPGWKAEVDGEMVSIHRTNYLLRGVWVGSGRQRVRFFYQPLSFSIGLGLTVMAGGMIAWCLLRKRR